MPSSIGKKAERSAATHETINREAKRLAHEGASPGGALWFSKLGRFVLDASRKAKP